MLSFKPDSKPIEKSLMRESQRAHRTEPIFQAAVILNKQKFPPKIWQAESIFLQKHAAIKIHVATRSLGILRYCLPSK